MLCLRSFVNLKDRLSITVVIGVSAYRLGDFRFLESRAKDVPKSVGCQRKRVKHVTFSLPPGLQV